jgi:hypothetical protein
MTTTVAAVRAIAMMKRECDGGEKRPDPEPKLDVACPNYKRVCKCAPLEAFTSQRVNGNE